MGNFDAAAGTTFGETLAITAVLKALIKSHPQPESIQKELAQQRQHTQALLESMPVPDVALHAYATIWDRVMLSDPAEDLPASASAP